MQTLQAPRDSLQPDQTPSRHDEQMLVARILPMDPYEAWLDQREADRRAAVDERITPAGRFSQVRPASAAGRVGRRVTR